MITGYNLDEEQSLAIEHPTSKIIIAGPGSGKTRILTANADYLLSKGQNVICICFTRTAAKEMTTRVKNLPATTIHSFCCAEVGWD
jgi:DNA helicase-2/ATP-dependent DNA helicase PcrA